MDITPSKILQLIQGPAGFLARPRRHRQRNQDLISVQTWVLASKVSGLECLDGFDGGG